MKKSFKKPKILLILPPSTVYFGDPTVPVVTPPLGLAYIAAYLEKFGYQVEILDTIAEGKNKTLVNKQKKYSLYGLNDKEILDKIKEFHPDIVGITSMYTAYAGDAHRVAGLVKRYDKKVSVVFGGAHATIFPELTLKDKNVDLVVMGEGELIFLDLVRKLEKNKSLLYTTGTIAKKGKKIIKNKPKEFIKNIDILPFPAWHLLPMESYLKINDSDYAMRNPGMVMITSRGCPGKCIYCSIHSVWGHFWRGRNQENVVDEIEKLVKEYGVKEIYFMDDSMGISPPRLEKICKEIIRRKIDIRWTVPNGIAHWTLNEDLLKLMKESGCYRITFGIESGNPQVRRFIGKPYPLEQAKKMIRYANKIGMWTICTNIIGFPEETREQIKDTVKFAIESDTDLAVFYLLCPHPGTQAYDIFKRLGLLNLDYILSLGSKLKTEDFAKIGQTLAGIGVKTKYLSQKELQEIVSSSYSTFLRSRLLKFLNPLRVKSKIHSAEDLKFVTKIFFNYLKLMLRNLGSTTFRSHMLRRDVD